MIAKNLEHNPPLKFYMGEECPYCAARYYEDAPNRWNPDIAAQKREQHQKQCQGLQAVQAQRKALGLGEIPA